MLKKIFGILSIIVSILLGYGAYAVYEVSKQYSMTRENFILGTAPDTNDSNTKVIMYVILSIVLLVLGIILLIKKKKKISNHF